MQYINTVLLTALLLVLASPMGCSSKDSNGDDDRAPENGEANSDANSDIDTDADLNANFDADAGNNTTYTVNEGGYIAVGDYSGYAWVTTAGDGTTVSQSDFSGTASGDNLCLTGTVGAMDNWSGLSILGVNLNQEMGDDTPVNSVVPSGDGLYVDVSNSGYSALRVQIQGPNGASEESDRWCAEISSAGGVSIPWSYFNTYCWNNEGSFYNYEPITAAMILVPGDNTDDINYDFCLNEMYPYSTGTDTGEDTSIPVDTGNEYVDPGDVIMSGSGTTTNRYRTIDVSRNGVPYKIITNGWGDNWESHTITWNGTAFSVDTFTGWDNGRGGPAGYPSAYCGTYSSTGNAPCGLPAPWHSLTSVKTGWTWSGGGGEYNAAYDIWVGDGENSRGFYMVWLRDPPNFRPAGFLEESNVKVSGLPGSWDIWHTMDGPFGRGITNYVQKEGHDMGSIEFDILDLVQDAQARGYGLKGAQLNGVAVGFEIWNGPVSNIQTTDFYVEVE